MAQGAKIVKGHTVQGELLSAGQFAVVASNYTYLVERREAEGRAGRVPAAGGAGHRPARTASALMKTATHPAAAMLFADWLLEEGQKVITDEGLTPSIASEGARPARGRRGHPRRRREAASNEGETWSKKYEAVVERRRRRRGVADAREPGPRPAPPATSVHAAPRPGPGGDRVTTATPAAPVTAPGTPPDGTEPEPGGAGPGKWLLAPKTLIVAGVAGVIGYLALVPLYYLLYGHVLRRRTASRSAASPGPTPRTASARLISNSLLFAVGAAVLSLVVGHRRWPTSTCARTCRSSRCSSPRR